MYTIKQASIRSQVGVPLLRAWERRYHVVAPTRTASGYRLYDEEAITRLRAMRLLVDQGWAPRQAAERVRGTAIGELAAMGSTAAEPVIGVPPTREAAPGEARRLVADLVDGAARMDGVAMEASLDEAFAFGRFEVVAERILLPALVGIGEAWADGSLEVAGEHAASSAVQRRLAMAFEAAGRDPVGPTVVVGLPQGSRHELAALAFATAARRAGLDAAYLGADVPTGSWAAAVERTGAMAVVMGAVMARDARRVSDAFGTLGRLHPNVLRAVGGRHASSVRLGHLVLPDGLVDAVAALQAALSAGRLAIP